MPVKKKLVKNPKVIRTMNGGTWTNAEFFGKIRSSLRQMSRWWVPATNAKTKARRRCKIKGRQLYEYQCAKCKNWFKSDQVHIDHLIEAGSLRTYDDLPGFVQRLFCDENGFQILCIGNCHAGKTKTMVKKKQKLQI